VLNGLLEDAALDDEGGADEGEAEQ